MGYTTTSQVRDSLSFEYWKPIQGKLAEDGYTVSPSAFAGEATFLQRFIDRNSDFIDTYLGSGPYAASGLLETACRWLCVYDVELYIISGTQDRVVSVSINEDKKRAIAILDKIVAGLLSVTLLDDTDTSMSPGLIEADGDGDPLIHDDLEDIWLSSGADLSDEYQQV